MDKATGMMRTARAGLMTGMVVMGVVLGAGAVLAQTPPPAAEPVSGLERNLPDAPVSSGAPILIEDADYGTGDDTPLGVDIAGVRVIGADEAVIDRPARGIGVGDVPGADVAGLEAALGPFVGQPLSQAAIARMQDAIASVWRAAGYPFMSVTVPPQEVTGGVLTLRVVEFTAGDIAPGDGAGPHDDRLTGLVRQRPGARIGADALAEDLDWINRNPYRNVSAVFAPGDERGASNIALQVSRERPFTGFASWSSTGSRATGRDRWSVGGGAWLPGLNDLTVSYRFTRDESIWRTGRPFGLDPGRAGYLSHAGRIDLPTWPRQSLSIAPNYVVTNELVAGTPFTFQNRTIELPVLYRSVVSNILPGRYWGDVYAGVEPKWMRRDTAFAGIDVARGEAGLVNLVLGWSHRWSDDHGGTALDMRIKANPGGIVSANSAEDWAAFSGGRIDSHRYVHLGVDVSRVTRLPHGWSWTSRLSGLAANRALPDPERLSLAGFYAVRGYDGNDGTVDAGFVWRNELRLPALAPLADAGIADRLSPFAFVDLGHGRDIGAARSTTLAGAGLGLDYAVADHLDAGLTGAFALTDAGIDTRSGDFTVTATIRASF